MFWGFFPKKIFWGKNLKNEIKQNIYIIINIMNYNLFYLLTPKLLIFGVGLLNLESSLIFKKPWEATHGFFDIIIIININY